MSANTSHPSNDNSQEPLLKQKLDLYHKDLKRGLELINAFLNDLSMPNETDANSDVLKVFHKSHQMLLQTYVTQTKELDSLKERLAQTEKELGLYKQVVDRAWASLKILKQ